MMNKRFSTPYFSFYFFIFHIWRQYFNNVLDDCLLILKVDKEWNIAAKISAQQHIRFFDVNMIEKTMNYV